MAVVGMWIRTPEVFNNASFMVIFPLSFIANTFVDTSQMPPVLRTFAEWNPVSAVTQAVRELFGNTNPMMPVRGVAVAEPHHCVTVVDCSDAGRVRAVRDPSLQEGRQSLRHHAPRCAAHPFIAVANSVDAGSSAGPSAMPAGSGPSSSRVWLAVVKCPNCRSVCSSEARSGSI